MGFVRGILLVLCSMIFFFSILIGGILYTVSNSLNYNSVQIQAFNVVQPIVQQLGLSQMIENNRPLIQQYCKTNSDYVAYYQGYTLHFSCQDINNTGVLINNTIKNLVSDLYYKTYDCGYWDCFSKYTPPLFLISEKSKSYWTSLFYYAVAAAIISAIALLFLFKRKYDLLFLSGGVIIFSSLLLLGIAKLILMFPNAIVSSILNLFFSQSNSVFIKMLIPGIALMLAGLIVEMFRAGFKLYNMFSRVGETDSEDKSENRKTKPEKNKK